MLLNFNSSDFAKAKNGEYNVRRRQDSFSDDAGYIRIVLDLLANNPYCRDYGVMITTLLADEKTAPVAGWLANKTYFFKEFSKSEMFLNNNNNDE